MKMICYKAAKYLQGLLKRSLRLQDFAYVNSQKKKEQKETVREKNRTK